MHHQDNRQPNFGKGKIAAHCREPAAGDIAIENKSESAYSSAVAEVAELADAPDSKSGPAHPG